jgi:hypothetical protein
MRSTDDTGDSDNSPVSERTVQNTLDEFDTMAVEDTTAPTSNGEEEDAPDIVGTSSVSRQESIDSFGGGPDEAAIKPAPATKSRALAALAQEAEMERVALTEAASGISRDELLITIAREVKVPLEDLDLVDGYLTDLELEGRVRRVGEVVVLPRPDDDDLLAMDLDEREFLVRYRRRYLAPEGGGTR